MLFSASFGELLRINTIKLTHDHDEQYACAAMHTLLQSLHIDPFTMH